MYAPLSILWIVDCGVQIADAITILDDHHRHATN